MNTNSHVPFHDLKLWLVKTRYTFASSGRILSVLKLPTNRKVKSPALAKRSLINGIYLIQANLV